MNSNSDDRYLKKVTKVIYDAKKRLSVKQELSDMMEDFMEAYMEMGMSKEDAREEAVRQMGDPEETGLLFNKIYRVKYDWKMVLYMLFWSVATRFFYLVLVDRAYTGWLVFVLFYPMGILISILEKWFDLPFLYVWAENWKGSGISNSGMILGVAVGCMPVSLQNWFLGFAVTAIFLMLQRSFMVEKRNIKEQKYLWEIGTALEDFDYKGEIQIDDKRIKVQIKKGAKARKGQSLIVIGLDGPTLLVDMI